MHAAPSPVFTSPQLVRDPHDLHDPHGCRDRPGQEAMHARNGRPRLREYPPGDHGGDDPPYQAGRPGGLLAGLAGIVIRHHNPGFRHALKIAG